MAKSKGGSYTPPTRAEVEAMRAEKFQLVPNGEAGRRERKLLEHYSGAHADLQWIVDNNAWHDLGFDTFTAWYTERVRPAVAAAGLRPTQEFALYVLENVQSDEAALPKQQRLLQRELADLVGVSVSTLRRLSQDPPQTSNGAGVDLEDADAPDPADIPDALTQAIRETATKTAAGAPTTPADGADTPEASVSDTAPAGSADASPVGGPGNPHTAAGDALGIRAMSSADGGERDRDRVDPPAAAEPLVTGLGGGNPQNSPAADSLPPQAHAGVPAAGGPDSPTRVEGRGSEAISSAGPDQQDLRSDRAPEVPAVATTVLPGIDHHDESGVSRRGEAPEVPRPSVEPEELEDGERASPQEPSSSDPDDEPDEPFMPRDRLLAAFERLADYIVLVQPDELGPQMFEDDLHTLDELIEEQTLFVQRLRKARFVESLHTP